MDASPRSPGPWPRRTLSLLLLVVLVTLAHGRVLRAGFVAPDYEILARAAEVGRHGEPPEDRFEPAPLFSVSPEELLRIEGDDGYFLSGLSLAASRRLWGPPDEDGVPPLGYRIENLLLLALAALGLHRFLRRFFTPWIGSEQAAAAARASAAFFFLYPLGAASVSRLDARGELLALALTFWSAAAFLRGRQDRRFPLTASAGVGAFLAGLSGELGLALPLLLGLSEFVSAHRYRKRRERLRTSSTTLLVFGGAVLLASSLRVIEIGASAAPGWTQALGVAEGPGRASELAQYAVEKLGVLVLPSNAAATGFIGTVLAGLLFLFAMQPALVAARSAPRLWGWMLVTWFGVLVFALLRAGAVRVGPEELGAGSVLLLPSAVTCVGLGVAVTSVIGISRLVRPLVVCVGFAVLANGNARPWMDAGRYVLDLRRDLVAARVLHGRDAPLVVVDDLGPVAGIDPVGGALAAIMHASFTGEPDVGSVDVRGVTEDAFLALAREREFDDLRRGSLVVVYRGASPEVPPGDGSTRRASVRLTAPEPGRGPRSWRREPRSPELDLGPLSIAGLRVTAPVGSDVSQANEVTWRARTPLELAPVARGTWWRESPVPEAMFDLSRDLAWCLGGRVRRLWFETGLTSLGEAELLTELPRLAFANVRVEPEALDADWYFRFESDPALRGDFAATGLRGAWVVGLLDLASLTYLELDGLQRASGTILVPGAAAAVRDFVRDQGGPVAWTLEFRVDGTTVAMERGRRIGRLGSREE